MRNLLPENNGASSEDQGMYRKYIVKRVDGKDQRSIDRHFNCEYFVLDISHDPAALPAIKAYADAIETTHPLLATELRGRYL